MTAQGFTREVALLRNLRETDEEKHLRRVNVAVRLIGNGGRNRNVN